MYVINGGRRKKKKSKKNQQQLQPKINQNKQQTKNKKSDPWSFVLYILKSLPWWIIKFIDWVYTVITATIVYLLT